MFKNFIVGLGAIIFIFIIMLIIKPLIAFGSVIVIPIVTVCAILIIIVLLGKTVRVILGKFK